MEIAKQMFDLKNDAKSQLMVVPTINFSLKIIEATLTPMINVKPLVLS